MTTITDGQLLELQAHAIATGDAKLRVATWVALGNDPRIGFEPTTERERCEARQLCADRLEMMSLTGTELRALDNCPGCGKPAHASETDDEGYHAGCRVAAEWVAEHGGGR